MFLLPFLLLLTIETTIAGRIDRMIDDMSTLIAMDRSIATNDSDFPVSLSYVFPEDTIHCASISGDMSLFYDHLLKDLMSAKIPIVVANNHNKFKCASTLIVVENVESLQKILGTQPFWSQYRYYILIYDFPRQEFRDFFLEKAVIFRDAEIAICVHKRYDQCLIYNPPDRELALTNTISSSSWIRTDPTVLQHRVIRFTMGNCDMHGQFTGNGTDLSGFEGIDWILFKRIVRKLNYTIQFVYTTEREYLGDFNGTWKNGILGSLVDNQADVGFCGIWIEARKFSPGIQMSVPINRVCVTYIVPRPTVTNIKVNAAKASVIWLNMGTLLAFSLAITAVARLKNVKSKPKVF